MTDHTETVDPSDPLALAGLTAWSPEARATFEVAASRAMEALQAHVDLVRQAGPEHGIDVSVAGAAVSDAVADLEMAEFALIGEGGEPGVADDETEVDDELLDELQTVAVVMQMDFAVDDLDEVIAAARQAVVDHDEMDAEDAEKSITEIESALFGIAHAHGWDRLLDDEVPGLAAISVYAQVVRDPEAVELDELDD